jgi:hypothetical protein
MALPRLRSSKALYGYYTSSNSHRSISPGQTICYSSGVHFIHAYIFPTVLSLSSPLSFTYASLSHTHTHSHTTCNQVSEAALPEKLCGMF